MRPALPYRFPGIDADMRRLRALLDLGLRAAEWSPPECPAILNLACGRADETGVLVHAIAPFAPRLLYLGIDLRATDIEEARARWLPAAPRGHEFDFRHGDASRPDRMRVLPEADFIFIRHQNFWHEPDVWTRLYRHALDRLKSGGLLAITSYFDREHELARACLRQFGARTVADIPHPHTRPLPDAPGKSVDRHLALFHPDS